ncbi:TBC1 domain family member 10A-like [Narcine bancroftii]|uniref:TBC1 domain family member 10A-like n=1 Tax=Narcine bancroftii TaxID=1343680 RepID=UPI003831C868
MRSRIWPLLCGAKVRMQQNNNIFKILDDAPGDRHYLDAIEKDLHRQFPFHEMFVSREGTGQQNLFRVLKAYSIYNPQDGYCQAQGPLAAVLLMQMPAEDAFWCLVQICEHYIPGYYSQGLEAVKVDGQVLFRLLRKVSPVAYKHLKKNEVDPLLYMTEWFLCLFTRTLPWVTMLRVWDMFLCEGVKIIFRVALVLLKMTLGSRDKLKDCQGLVETLEKLRNIPQRWLQDTLIIHEISELQISEGDIERETSHYLKKGGVCTPFALRLRGARDLYASSRTPPLSTPSPYPPLLGSPTLAPGLPSLLVSPPPPDTQQDPRGKPAARSRTFYVRRPSRPPAIPPRGGEGEGRGGTRRGKRNSVPLSSDTYF